MTQVKETKTFGPRLKEFRTRLELSQQDLAKAVDVGVMQVSNWENDRAMPNAFNLRALAFALDTSMDELMQDVEPDWS